MPTIGQIKEIIFRHRTILILTFVVSILYGFHHPVMWLALREQNLTYHPTLMIVDERYHTAPRIKEIYLTGKDSGDISLAEYKDAPAWIPPLPNFIMGYLAKALGSVKRAFIASNFIFPPISFLLFYFLFFEITQRRTLATLFAALSTIIPRYLAFFPLFTKYYQAWFLVQLIKPQSRLYLNRLNDPLLTVPFFLLALYLIFRSLHRNERITPYLAGISFGILFSVYFYYAVYLSVSLGIMGVIFLLKKQYETLKKIGIIIGIGTIVSLPYWSKVWGIIHLPAYRDIAARLGPEHTYLPFLYPEVLFAYLQHTLLALGIWFLLRKRYPQLAAYLVGLLLAVFFVYNFQIITGFNPQPDHWIKPRQFILTLNFFVLGLWLFTVYGHLIKFVYLIPPLLLAAGLLIVRGLTTKNTFVQYSTLLLAAGSILIIISVWFLKKYLHRTGLNYLTYLAWLAIVFLFIKGALTANRFINDNLANATLPPAEERSLIWLIQNTPPGSVIGTPSAITNTLIKHFTQNRIFVPDGLDTVASNREILNRFYLINRVFRVDSETFGSYFATKENFPPQDEDHEGISYLFVDQYRAREPGSIFSNKGFIPPYWPDEFHQKIVDKYTRILNAERVSIPYRLDYIYYGPREQKFARDPTTHNPSLLPVYRRGGITIYKIGDKK